MIYGNGRACVTDFGLSTMIEEFVGTSYLTSSIRGNIRWAAAELYDIPGEDDAPVSLSAECDVYSFGSIILQVLTCKVPYHDVKNNNAVLGHIARGKKPEPPKGSQVAPVYWEFIQRCWLPRASRPSIQEIVLFAHQQYCELHPNDAVFDENSSGNPCGIWYGTWSRHHWSGHWSDTENDESDESDDDSSSETDQDAEGEGLDKNRDNREDDRGEEGQQGSEGDEHDQSSGEDDDEGEGDEGVDHHDDRNEVISLDGGDEVEGDEDLEDGSDYASYDYDNDGDDGDWIYDSNESW